MSGQALLQFVATLIGGGAVAAFGKWFIEYMNTRSAGDEKRTAQQEGRERNIIGEYQKILDEKDRSHDRERQEWKAERDQMRKENGWLRRMNGQMNIDNEAMRARIEGLQREILRVGGSPAMLTDVLDSVVITNSFGDIWWANEAAGLYLRISTEKLITKNISEFIPESLRKRHEDGMERARKRGTLARGVIVERVIRAKARLNDGVEFPTDIYLGEFFVDGTLVFRAQLRRRFERPDDDEDTYVPPTATASSSGIFPAIVIETATDRKGNGKDMVK